MESLSRLPFCQKVVCQMIGWRHHSDYSDLLQRKKKRSKNRGGSSGRSMYSFSSYHFSLLRNVSDLCLENISRLPFCQKVVGQMRGWRHHSDYSDLLQRKKKCKKNRGGSSERSMDNFSSYHFHF